MERRRLLFISPTLPAEEGNGLAMRAGLFLEALAADHEVHLLVVPAAGGRAGDAIPDFVGRHAARASILACEPDPLFQLIARVRDPAERLRALERYPRPLLARFATRDAVREAERLFADTRFDTVHVMRLYLAGFAQPYLDRRESGGGPALVLDLDECESRTRARLGALLARRGADAEAALERVEAAKHAGLERTLPPRFDRVLAASAGELEALAGPLSPERAAVVPNAVALPAAPPPRPARTPADPFTLLLVGTLGYLPNEDAALFLCERVLDELREQVGAEVRLLIVGSGPSPAVRALASLAGVTVTGRVPEVLPYYGAADTAVVPIRAGGGTRIKILEAFALGVPVVATPEGAEGLEVVDGEHLLLADDPSDFAAACARLRHDPALAGRLIANARRLVARLYARERVAATIREIYRAL